MDFPTHVNEISYLRSTSHSLILFAGNGSIHQRTYSQFGTIAWHAISLCSNVLPHSCTEVLFLLWSTQTRYKTGLLIQWNWHANCSLCEELSFIIVCFSGKACIKKVLLSNCLQELMELHQVIAIWITCFGVQIWSSCTLQCNTALYNIFWTVFPCWFSSTLFSGEWGRGNWYRAGWKLVFLDFSSAHMWYVSCPHFSFAIEVIFLHQVTLFFVPVQYILDLIGMLLLSLCRYVPCTRQRYKWHTEQTRAEGICWWHTNRNLRRKRLKSALCSAFIISSKAP